MSIIQERTAEVAKLMAEVKNHCMCLKFEDDSQYFRVFYPEGYYPQGVQINYSLMGKAVALRKLIEYMEKHWKASFI
jgi:hypothetical protein